MIKFEHLLEIPFVHGTSDCFQLARAFYNDNFEIETPDFAYPQFWAETHPELDLMRTNFRKLGFEPVDVNRRSIRPADLLLMNIGGQVVNHCAVYLTGGWFLHHPFREKSRKDLWAGSWFDQTMIVARHPEVRVLDERPTVDLLDLLPPAKRKMYRDALSFVRARGPDPA